MQLQRATTELAALSKTNSHSSDELVERAEPTPATQNAIRELESACEASEHVVLACEHSAEGALTAVALSYYARADPERLRILDASCVQPQIGESVVEVPTDAALAVRVFEGLEARVVRGCSRSRGGRCLGGCSGACTRRIAFAAASDSPSMLDAVFRYVRCAFTEGPSVARMISHEDAAPCIDLATSVSSECEKTRQFVRFSHMRDGSYLGVFRPNADTIPLTASYFKARMGTERFCLVDPRHKVAAFHDKGELAVVRIDDAMATNLAAQDALADDEIYVRAMWKLFYDRLELGGRRSKQRGYDLRTHFMPQRLWENLPELDGRLDSNHGQVPARYTNESETLDFPKLTQPHTKRVLHEAV